MTIKNLLLNTAFKLSAIAILAVTILAGCQKSAQEKERTEFLMDTFVTLKVPAATSPKILDETFGRIEELSAEFSKFDTTSAVYRLNRGEHPPLSTDMRKLLEKAAYFHDITKGDFDITLAPLTGLWFFGPASGNSTSEFTLPPKEKVAKALALVDQNKISQKEATLIMPPGFGLDLGGIAKGYIVDRVADYLEDSKVERFLINAGGDIRIGGKKEWRIGVRDPRRAEEVICVIGLSGPKAVVTSGDYEQFVELDGVRYHHILDPKTGYPARASTSVTVVAEGCITADALATALFVMGPNKGLALVNKLPGVECLITGPDYTVYKSKGWSVLER